jgi:EmrB/QacA subfamily drug resistance transporter
MAAVAMSIFLATIDGSIVNVALPTLVRDLNTNFATIQWVVLAYLLTMATLMLSIGRLGDMIGKKPIYNAGFVVFTIGSVLCGLSPSVYWLIAFRVLQAVGAAMTLALGAAIVTEAFPGKERGRALGLIGTIVSLGVIIGPTVGGVMIEALSWHWIFFVNLPIGIIGTIMAWRFVPNFKPLGRQRFDYWGALTLFISLLALLLALTLGQQLGFSNSLILLLFGIWFIFLTLFLVIETRAVQPMIDLRIFRNILFSVNLVTGFMTFVAIAGIFILLPFYLEDVLNYDTQQVGLLLAVVPVGLGIFAPIAGALSDRFGTRPITVLGLFVLLVGYVAVTSLSTETTTWGYILRLFPIGIGMGIFQSPNNSAIMGTVPRERLGVASGLLSITRTLGQTVGIAILGALWASRVMVYTGQFLSAGATTAPHPSQVAGLHDTFTVVTILIVLGLALSIWGLVQERRLRGQMAAVQINL